MDTNSKEYQEALNDLSHAFLRFIKVTNGVVPQELIQIAVASSYQHILNLIGEASAVEPLERVDSSQKHDVLFNPEAEINQQVPIQNKVIKYAGNPVCRDGSFVFNRLSSNPSDQTKYVIEIVNDDAEFEVFTLTGINMLNAFYAKQDAYPDGVTILSGEPQTENATLKSRAKGKGKARGLIIDILSPCAAEYNN